MSAFGGKSDPNFNDAFTYKARAAHPSLKEALPELSPQDTCETLTMITLRREESIFSDVITELPAGLDVKVLELSSAEGPRRRAKVSAGNVDGWITVLTSFNEPLIRLKPCTEVAVISKKMVGCLYKLKCMTQVREGEGLDTALLRELGPGAVIRLADVSSSNPRRGKVAHELVEGWISLATSLGQFRVVGPLTSSEGDNLPSTYPGSGIDAEAEQAAAENEAARVAARRNEAAHTAAVRRVVEESLRKLLDDPAARPSADELRSAVEKAVDAGVDEEQVARARQAAELQEARERLTASCEKDTCDVEALRADIQQARDAGLTEVELYAAREKLAKEERKAYTLSEMQGLAVEMGEVNMSSLESVREAKERLMEILTRARAEGCPEADLRATDILRKRLHNAEEDLKGAIRVFARVRPLSKKEQDEGDVQVVKAVDSMTVAVQQGRHAETFSFDAVFVPGTQEEVFEDCKHLCQSVLDGFNVTLFAYGQTGAGKTYTMYGKPGSEGTAMKTIGELFRLIERDSDRYDHTVSASMMELYRNELIDLLASGDKAAAAAAAKRKSVSGGSNPASPSRRETMSDPAALPRLAVKTDTKTGEVQIENLTEEVCPGAIALARVLEKGAQQRKVACTAMNSESSRSHLLLTVRVIRTDRVSGERVQGKIMMCDLAGSERLKKSEAVGDTMKESIEINKSLTAIGDVIEALTTGQRHVPYKNHKLTQVLQDALGGSSKTLMFVNCSPASSNLEETVNALKYAMRVKNVVSKRNVSQRLSRQRSLTAG